MCVYINVFLFNYYFNTQLSNTYILQHLFIVIHIYVLVYTFIYYLK
jgi:hypothetical protein